MTIVLGATYKDVITGFTGVAVGYVEYISGCNQALIQPKAVEASKYNDSFWFDEQRLKRVKAKLIVLDNGAHPGFDREPPKR